MELDLGDSGIAYSPGDLLAILPRQRPDAVTALLQRCGLDPQSLVQVERLDADGSGSGSPMTRQVGTVMHTVFMVGMPCLVTLQSLQHVAPGRTGIVRNPGPY